MASGQRSVLALGDTDDPVVLGDNDNPVGLRDGGAPVVGGPHLRLYLQLFVTQESPIGGSPGLQVDRRDDRCVERCRRAHDHPQIMVDAAAAFPVLRAFPALWDASSRSDSEGSATPQPPPSMRSGQPPAAESR